MATKNSKSSQTTNRISTEVKNFYSAGATFSTAGCAGSVLLAWTVLGRIFPFLRAEYVGLILSYLIVFAYALVIPEPMNYPNAGKMRITLAEMLFGLFNGFIVFAIVLGLKNLK